MMNEIRELYDMILTSLAIQPATMQELLQRDFLKNRAEYGIWKVLGIDRTRWYEDKNNVLHVYARYKHSYNE